MYIKLARHWKSEGNFEQLHISNRKEISAIALNGRIVVAGGVNPQLIEQGKMPVEVCTIEEDQIFCKAMAPQLVGYERPILSLIKSSENDSCPEKPWFDSKIKLWSVKEKNVCTTNVDKINTKTYVGRFLFSFVQDQWTVFFWFEDSVETRLLVTRINDYLKKKFFFC